ncbi:MAG: cytosine deaminase, partial [Ilumatobacteraceae bacterium]
LQDPFNPVGRGDCLETAGLMIMAGHVLPGEAYDMVSGTVRRLMGRAPAGTSIGQVADLVLVPATTIREAIAFGPIGRTVIRAGRVVNG